jgi:hypothetical protein
MEDDKKKNENQKSFSRCAKLIGDFEECMRPFHSRKKDFKENYYECSEKFKKEFKLCGFEPRDIY